MLEKLNQVMNDCQRIHNQLKEEIAKKRPDVFTVRKCYKELISVVDSDETNKYLAAVRPNVWRLLILGSRRNDLMSEKIRDINENLSNQKVILADVRRSHFSDCEDDQILQSKLLTYYCKRRNMKYKQGLHEILVPFMLLQTPRLPDEVIANMFYAFILKFMPHTFSDEEFNSLQCSLRLYRLLVLYHDPELCNILDQYGMTPELFATPWLMTMWAHSTPPRLLFRLWDFYLVENNPYLHHFVALMLLISHRKKLLNVDHSVLPEVLRSIQITEENIGGIIKGAVDLQTRTPKSICKNIFVACYDERPPSLDMLKELESASSLSVSPGEVLQQLTSYTSLSNSNPPHPHPHPAMKFFVLDCRSAKEFEAEHLVSAMHVDPGLHHHPEELSELLSNLDAMRECHLCITGGGPREGSITSSVSSSITNSNKLHVISETGIGEERAVTNLILLFLQRGFPFISQLAGGYSALRDMIRNKCLNGIDISDVLYSHSKIRSMISHANDNTSRDVSMKVDNDNYINITTSRSTSRTAIETPDATLQSIAKINTTASLMLENFKSKLHDKITSSVSKFTSSSIASLDSEKKENKKINRSKEDIVPRKLSNDSLYFHMTSWLIGLESTERDVTTFRSKYIEGDGYLLDRFIVVTSTFIYITAPHKIQIEYSKIHLSFPIKNLVKITSRKTVDNLCVFHYRTHSSSDISKVVTVSLITENMKDCISTVTERYKIIKTSRKEKINNKI